MKKALVTSCSLLAALCLAVLCVPTLGAQEAISSSAAVAPSSISFTLIIVGTRHYSDVDIMRRNIARIPMMQKFVQTVSSQKHIQFLGLFGGTEEGLVQDIRGLAADRFEVATRNDKARGLVVTLRKINDQEG